MARGLWAAGVAVLLAWGCGGREDFPVRVEAPRPDTGVPQEGPSPVPPVEPPGPGPEVSDPLPPLPDVEAPSQEFQWLRRLSGEPRSWGLSVAFTPDGSTVLLSRVDVPRVSPEGGQYTTLQLDAWTREGAPRWSRRAPGYSSMDDNWVYELRSTSTGVLVLDSPGPDSDLAMGVDLGCGALNQGRLVRLDAEGRCLNQTALDGLVSALALDGADHAYLAADVKGWSLPYVRLDASGRRVSELPPAQVFDWMWLGWSEAGGLVGIHQGEGDRMTLNWFSPEFQLLRSRAMPGLGRPSAVSPEGRIVTRTRQGEAPWRWGERELPAGSNDVVLVIEPDGTPGAAIVLDSSFKGIFQVEADTHGLVVAGVSTVGSFPGQMTYSLELLAYGWDGALQRRQVVAEGATPVCEQGRHSSDIACLAELAFTSLEVHPRHGIRLAGGVRGPAKFVAAGEEVEAGAAQSFVMAFKR